MSLRRGLAAMCGAALGAALGGCGLLSLGTYLNPNFLSSLGVGEKVATLPGNAPGLLVTTENRTSHPSQIYVSYRDPNGSVQAYTATLAAGEQTAQMLVCPIAEITLGDVANLQQTAARVYLTSGSVTDPNALANAPFIEVEPFGVLLRSAVNYACGDGVTFTIEGSSATSSGYRAFAYFRSGAGM